MATKLNRIIQGDCIKQLAKIDAGCVDLVFADPPFNIGYDYDVYDDKRSCEDYLDWSQRWVEGVLRVLKPDGAFWLAIGDEYAAELKVLATRELGLTCRSWVVWYYTFGVHCKYKFTRSHTHLFHFVKDAKRFTFNTDAIRVPSARQLVYGDKRANPKGRVPDDTWVVPPAGAVGRHEGTEGRRHKGRNNQSRARQEAGNLHARDGNGAPSTIDHRQSTTPPGWILRPQDLPDGFCADSDTWYYPRVCGTFKEREGFHGCQMPEQLLGRIIRACSNEGDTVLDPFTGSGTTLAVAKKLGREYLGLELSEQYVTETRTRLRRIKTGDPLDGFENPLTSVANTANGTIRTADGKRVRMLASAAGTRDKSAIPTPESSTARTSQEVSRGILEAFKAVHRGYSLDWLLASKELQAEFAEMCRKLGIRGAPRDWNSELLRFRKSKLHTIPTSKRPRLDRERLHECEFASEIALSELRRALDITLDAILCDPRLAARFDALASQIAPGGSPEYYRWAALAARKRAGDRSRPALKFRDEIKRLRFSSPEPVSALRADRIPERAGIYVLRRAIRSKGMPQDLYIGETGNLGRWFRERLDVNTFELPLFRSEGGTSIHLRYLSRIDVDSVRLRAWQLLLVRKNGPSWNYRKQGESAA